MEKEVKIQLYKIVGNKSADVVDICYDLSQKTPEKRLQVVNGYSTRLESFRSTTPQSLCFIDFCKQRFSGPGLSSKQKLTVEFDLQDDESFGEITSWLVSPSRHFVLAQYNHYGARTSAIVNYLNTWIPEMESISLEPLLKGDLMGKLLNAESVKWVETKFNFSGLDRLPEEVIANASARNVWATLKSFDQDHAAQLEIKVSKQRGNFSGMSSAGIVDYLRSVLTLADEEILKSAKVTIDEGDGVQGEMLDLLRAKEEISVEVEWDGSAGRMIPDALLHRALTQSYIHWRNRGMLDEKDT